MGTPWSSPFHTAGRIHLGLEPGVRGVMAGRFGWDPRWGKKPLGPSGTCSSLGLTIWGAARLEDIVDMGLDIAGARLPTWGAVVAQVSFGRSMARFPFLQRALPFGGSLRINLETGLPG